jgi:hypothetical protein
VLHSLYAIPLPAVSYLHVKSATMHARHYSNAILACALRSDILKDAGVIAAILAPLTKRHLRPLLK